MDLSTKYLGLDLPHPFMPGASPLVDDLDTVVGQELVHTDHAVAFGHGQVRPVPQFHGHGPIGSGRADHGALLPDKEFFHKGYR